MTPLIIQGIYAAAAVADFDAALDWYAKFMGRRADDRPLPVLAQWRKMGTAGLQLWKDDDRAGKGIMTIVVPDLSVEKQRLASEGIAPYTEAAGDFGRVANFLDPEGNRIVLAEPPKGYTDR